MDRRTRTLFEVNIDDILLAVGWQNVRALRGLVRRVAGQPALRFAQEMTRFDEDIEASGIAAAARSLLAQYVRGVRVCGVERIPREGPVLLLANHPGMTDTLALFVSIPRSDLLVLAAERPFLRALPAASRSLVSLPEGQEGRLTAMRRAVTHLRTGGALLTFPAGEIEPDPAVLSGAVQALSRWSESSTVFLRLVPDCMVVPMVVSGVLARQAQRSPLRFLRRRRVDRERLAAMLQVLMHTIHPSAWRVRVRVDAAGPFAAREILARGKEAPNAITEAVARLLRLRERA